KVLEKNEVLTEFDRYVLESIVEKVIIGEVDEDGNTNPYKLTFIYKTEYSNSIQSKMHKQINRKRTQNDVKDLPSHPLTDTCRDGSIDVKKIRRKVMRLLKSMDFRILEEILKDIFQLEKHLVGTYQ